MLKTKMFALASVTTLTGLVMATSGSGCSSPPEATEDAGTDAPTSDVRGDRADVDTGPPEESTCPTTTAIDATKLPWKSPT
ncbi:MAG: hypothetical protein KF819_15865, partial [Labilithrix sp.]|nr:hypothetical protein [Labilithrix sp.]